MAILPSGCMVPRMSRLSPIALFLRLMVAFALVAPHGARAEGADGLVLVICGAEGAYEIALGDPAPAVHDHRHDCCILCGAFQRGEGVAASAFALFHAPARVALSAFAPRDPPPGIPAPRGPPVPV